METAIWTPSVCESFSSATGNVTPDLWETCDWSGNEEETNLTVGNIWDVCDWSSTDVQSIAGSPEREECGLNNDSLCALGGTRSSTPTNFQLGVNFPASSSLLPSLSPVWRSPRSRTPQIKFDPSRVVTTGDGWQVLFVMDLQGCQPKCVSKVHGWVSMTFSLHTVGSLPNRRIWFEYFTTNCPHNEYGEKDPKNRQYILCGRSVCQAVWQAVLSISTSTFYSLQKHFLDGKCSDQNMRIRSLALKSMAAVEWTNSYFSRVGDKRPDKDGIFTILPLGKVYL